MRAYFLLLLFLFPALATCQAQQSTSRSHAWTVGAFAELGLQGGNSNQSGLVFAGAEGVYVDLLRGRFHSGLEVRGAGANGIRGTLTGPRFSFDAGYATFFVSALFGPQHYESATVNASQQSVTQDIQGVTSEGVIGVELFSPTSPRMWGCGWNSARGFIPACPDPALTRGWPASSLGSCDSRKANTLEFTPLTCAAVEPYA